MRFLITPFTVLLLLATTTAVAQNRREAAVRNDKRLVGSDGTWVYDNLLVAMDKAKTQKMPVMALIRCVP